ncbi:MAG: hypothetical protein ACRDRX_03095 [Pseudonocardiaceae bacterium]
MRDTTFHEDASTLRTGTAAHTMAIIRNTLIAAIRLTGWHNLKQALRHCAHAFDRCVDLITKPLKSSKIEHDGAVGKEVVDIRLRCS